MRSDFRVLPFLLSVPFFLSALLLLAPVLAAQAGSGTAEDQGVQQTNFTLKAEARNVVVDVVA